MTVDVSSDKTWHALGDPELKCYMPGVPRITYMPYPFQIVQGSSPYILMSYAFASATRTIRMNWKERGPIDSWMGWSRGCEPFLRDAGRPVSASFCADRNDHHPEQWLVARLDIVGAHERQMAVGTDSEDREIGRL
jgi:hypothetical protein